MPSDDQPQDQPTAELLQRLTEQTSTLIRQEMALARTEIQESPPPRASGRRSAGPSALFGLCAAGTFVAAAILGLATVIPAWAAALGVALVFALLALLAADRTGAGRSTAYVPNESRREAPSPEPALPEPQAAEPGLPEPLTEEPETGEHYQAEDEPDPTEFLPDEAELPTDEPAEYAPADDFPRYPTANEVGSSAEFEESSESYEREYEPLPDEGVIAVNESGEGPRG